VGILWDLVELPIAGFAAWTLAYHLTVLGALPARRVWVIAALLVPPAVVLVARGRSRRDRRLDAVVGAALLLAIGAGAMTFVTSSPNLDDLSFFHRALVQLHHLRQPFHLADTLHDTHGIPSLSILHSLTAYEPLMAMGAHAIGLDPLWAYQHVGAFCAAASLALTLVLLSAELGVAPGLSVAAAACAITFLALDGNVIRSFGNVALGRFWQGKCILWSALLPATLLLVYRFLRAPAPRHHAMVVLAGISAVGLSGSGTVVFPALVLSVALADLLALRLRHPGPPLLAVLGSAYPCAIGLAFAAGVLPRPDMETWSHWEPVWWRNAYGYVVGDPSTLVRDLCLLLVPAFALEGRARLLLVLLPPVIVALFLNPLSGPIVLRVITPANYWRFVYLFPLPLCAGLIVACWTARGRGRRSVAVLALIAIAAAFRSPVYAANPLGPTAGYELPPAELAFARATLPRLRPGDRVLAPEQVVWTLALLDPTLRFVAGRSIETPSLFRAAGRADGGMRRAAAQAFVTTGTPAAGADAGLRDAIARGLRAVVTPTASEAVVTAAITAAGGHAMVATEAADYGLLLLSRSGTR
jgi:hypothetical protein